MQGSAKAGWAAARPTQDHVVSAVCVAPWVSIEFDPSGWVYACCTSGLYPLGRIGHERLRDLWGGPRSQVLREALLDWDLSVACGPCKWHLEHGRMDPVAAVYDRYPVSSPDPERPFMMLFALSNRCNLGCIMCTPELSTTLRSEAGLPPLPTRYDDAFFEDLKPLLPSLKLAKFLGGEPFLAPEHKRVWELLDELDEPPRMQVTTNGTVWTPYVEWLLDRFEVDISISIDAHTAPTYAAIRRGGDHAELLTNVDRFAESCRRRGTELHVSYCLMDRNWHELGDFLAWAERFDIPSSVNLVTDDGLALHDTDLDHLLEVQARWSEDHERLSDQLHKNLGVWQTQLQQLEAVIAERRAGVTPAPRQSQPTQAHLFEPDPATRTATPERLPWRRSAQRRRDLEQVADRRRRLSAWAGGGEVAELHVSVDGRITAVAHEHQALGLRAPDLVGEPLAAIIAAMEHAQARPAWVVEVDDDPDHAVVTLALARDRPLRGTVGAIVRTVRVPTATGWAVLVAQDLIYDRPDALVTPVTIGTKAGSGAP